MSFEFEHPSRPIEDNVRAVAKAEFDRAIAEITETGFEVHETVRSVRRRLKRVRSIIRLIRPAFHDHARENRHLRDMGAEVSALRDAAALVEAVDLLSKRANGAGEALPALRERLAGRAAAEEMKLDREAFLLGLRGRLREARVRSELWDLSADGAGAVVPGFVKTYTRARAGFRLAHRAPTREHLHEWRKAVKFHWAQLGLLRRFAPEFAEARRAQAKKLAETLGDHHNLCGAGSGAGGGREESGRRADRDGARAAGEAGAEAGPAAVCRDAGGGGAALAGDIRGPGGSAPAGAAQVAATGRGGRALET